MKKKRINHDHKIITNDFKSLKKILNKTSQVVRYIMSFKTMKDEEKYYEFESNALTKYK